MKLVQLETLLTSNKEERKNLAQSIVMEINDGNLDPTNTLIWAAKGEEFFKSIVDNVRPIVASKGVQKGGLTMYEAEISERKNPDKYDYASANDYIWNSLNASLIEIKEKMKEREIFLKALKEPIATMEGEVINPPQKTFGAQNVTVKFL